VGCFIVRDKNKVRDYGQTQINNALEEHNLGYTIDIKGRANDIEGRPTFWKVVRIDLATDTK